MVSNSLGSETTAESKRLFLFSWASSSLPRDAYSYGNPHPYQTRRLLLRVAQVILQEGSELSALAGLLGCSVAAVRLRTEEEGGGVCLTLREEQGKQSL